MKIKRAVSVLIALLMCLVIGVANASADGDMTIMSDPIIQSVGISLSKSGTKITATFSLTAKETASIIGAPSYDVQQYVDGAWTTVADSLTGEQTTNRVTYSFSKTYTGVAGGKYRFKAKFYCKLPDGSSQSATYTSTSVTL